MVQNGEVGTPKSIGRLFIVKLIQEVSLEIIKSNNNLSNASSIKRQISPDILNNFFLDSVLEVTNP